MRFLLFLTLSVLLPLSCYAQAPSNITANKTTQGANGWNTYTDPEGKFTIQYPSYIEITPKQNRFDKYELEFSNQNQSITGSLSYKSDGTNETSPQRLKQIVEATNTVIGKVLSEFGGEFRVIDTNDTQLNGDYAISQITYNKISDGSEKGTWDVFSLKDNQIFKFAYISTTNDFDKGLPTVQKMLNSLKFQK